MLNHWGFDYAVSILTNKDAPYALFVFHLDNLEQINEIFDQKAAKQTVICLASLLRSYTRESDILSRFYGDEFVAIVKKMDSESIALQKGNDICNCLLYTSSCAARAMRDRRVSSIKAWIWR